MTEPVLWCLTRDVWRSGKLKPGASLAVLPIGYHGDTLVRAELEKGSLSSSCAHLTEIKYACAQRLIMFRFEQM